MHGNELIVTCRHKKLNTYEQGPCRYDEGYTVRLVPARRMAYVCSPKNGAHRARTQTVPLQTLRSTRLSESGDNCVACDVK